MEKGKGISCRAADSSEARPQFQKKTLLFNSITKVPASRKVFGRGSASASPEINSLTQEREARTGQKKEKRTSIMTPEKKIRP